MTIEKVLVNKAQCLSCNDIIESLYTHDYRRCRCGNIAVDGGKSYIRRTAVDLALIKDLSEFEYKEVSDELNTR